MKKHGHCVGGKVDSVYSAYHCARRRCENPKDPRYPIYGARGIKFLYSSFEQFAAEMGPAWKPGLSIERKNNNGHYEPGNLRWATDGEQARNRRTNIWIEYGGVRLCLWDWAKKIGIRRTTLAARIKAGWPLEMALSPNRFNRYSGCYASGQGVKVGHEYMG